MCVSGYYCASPELSVYSVTYPAKEGAYDDTLVPPASDLVKSVFKDGVDVEPSSDFQLDAPMPSDTYSYIVDPESAATPEFFKARVIKK